MSSVRLNGVHCQDPHDARAAAGLMTTLTLSGDVGPEWIPVVLDGVRMTSLVLDNPSQQVLDMIGLILPKLPQLATLTCLAITSALALDLSPIFDGCNSAPQLVRLNIYFIRITVPTIALAPDPRREVKIMWRDDDAPPLWSALSGNRIRIGATSISPQVVLAIHACRPAALRVGYDDAATALKRAARDFLDIPCDVHIVGIRDSYVMPETDREFQDLRALFALATATSGPANRFVDGSWDGALVGRIKEFL